MNNESFEETTGSKMSPLVSSAIAHVAPGSIGKLAYKLADIDGTASAGIGQIDSIGPMLTYSQYVSDLKKFNTDAAAWDTKMKGRKEAVEEREKNAKEAFPKPIKDLTKTLEACPDKPVKPNAPEKFNFGYVLKQVVKDNEDFDSDNAKPGSYKLGLPTADGLVSTGIINNRMTYLTAASDSTKKIGADVSYVYGRFGQSPDIAPTKAVAFAPATYDKDIKTPGLMVSLFPDNGDDTGLSADTKFVTIEGVEAPLFDGSNAHGDKMFETVSAASLGDYKYDNYCLGAASLAGSVLTLAAVASTLY